MSNGLLLLIDDETELLKAHTIFFEKKGYEVVMVSNGIGAVDQCQTQTFDLVLLDEQMPSLSGLEMLQRVKEIQPVTPVVMVTRNEEEDIMDQAIGVKIADYLTKPVSPNQILPILKKDIHRKEIVTEVIQSGYQQNYLQIVMQVADCRTFNDWKKVYRELVYWEFELGNTDSNMTETLRTQREEINNGFAKYIAKNYLGWVAPLDNKVNSSFSKLVGQRKQQTSSADNRSLLSADIFKSKAFPLIDKDEKIFLIVIDNSQLDQWRILLEEIGDMSDIERGFHISTPSTVTQYTCNAIFSDLMPKQIAAMFPELWVDEDEEEDKNLNEESLIRAQIDRYCRRDKFSYHRINNSTGTDKLMQ